MLKYALLCIRKFKQTFVKPITNMENFIENPRYQNYDTRTFQEIWFTLPAAARSLLVKDLEKRKIRACMYMRWLRAEAVPTVSSTQKIIRALRQKFGIRTLPYTLFPDKETREALAKKYFSAPEKWDGTVRWKTMEKELNEDPQEDELKYLEH